jgi:hypothetical protein
VIPWHGLFVHIGPITGRWFVARELPDGRFAAPVNLGRSSQYGNVMIGTARQVELVAYNYMNRSDALRRASELYPFAALEFAA